MKVEIKLQKITRGMLMKFLATFVLFVVLILGLVAIPSPMTNPYGDVNKYTVFDYCSAPLFKEELQSQRTLVLVTCWQYPVLGVFCIFATLTLFLAILDVVAGLFIKQLANFDYCLQFMLASFTLAVSVFALASGVRLLEEFQDVTRIFFERDLLKKQYILYELVITAGTLGLLDFFLFCAAGFMMYTEKVEEIDEEPAKPPPVQFEPTTAGYAEDESTTATSKHGKSKHHKHSKSKHGHHKGHHKKKSRASIPQELSGATSESTTGTAYVAET